MRERCIALVPLFSVRTAVSVGVPFMSTFGISTDEEVDTLN